MEKLTHLPLERYKERYTENLVDWEKKVFSDYFEYRSVEPSLGNAALNIRTGQVLDSNTRPFWCLQQVGSLLAAPPVEGYDKLYFSDFYTSGLDAIAYSQRYGIRPRMYSFLWAQTFDQYDFTRQLEWMRAWEVMAFELYDGVFVASSLLKDLIVSALPHVENKVHVVGLPFNVEAVQSDFEDGIPIGEFDCIYTSRWDIEKNPNDFLDLVEYRPDLKFAISTGASELRGTDEKAIYRVRELLNKGTNLTSHLGVSKTVYHSLLLGSKVQFNCASQDWVSFTLLEALAFNCVPLYPNFRSFPEALMYSSRNLYAPGDIKDASGKLDEILADPTFPEREPILEYYNGTLHRIADIIQKGE
jgi:hypothetical protein